MGSTSPGHGRILPFFGDIAQRQIDLFGGGLIVWEVTPAFKNLSQLHRKALDCVGRIDHFPDLRRISIEGDHLFPVTSPALGDHWILLTPDTRLKLG